MNGDRENRERKGRRHTGAVMQVYECLYTNVAVAMPTRRDRI